MCRIAGLFNKNDNPKRLNQLVRQMCELQKHGGPDDHGNFIDDTINLALGHQRLSILDPSPLGHQPMFLRDRYVIVFNGEIYNFKDLKKDLEKRGHTFNGNSDTEVILHAFEEWGTSSFLKLEGMFALAIYDQVQKELFLIRDSQGIKPLYYFHQENILAFASEVKAFSCLPIGLEKNLDWPLAFLTFGHLPEPITTLKNVFSLPKGCYAYLKLNQANHCEIINFTALAVAKLDISIPEAQELIDIALNNAIEKQLIADVPLGVFLSGGIDSSLIAMQAAKYQKDKLCTVSLHFPEINYSEKKYQDIISKNLPGKHISQEITKTDFNNHFEEILDAMDQPTSDGINTWFVSKAAQEAGLKAVLSGLGADELFGGYPSFQRIDKVPLLRSLGPLISSYAKISGNDALQRVAYLKNQKNPNYEYLFLRGFFNPIQLQKLFQISGNQQQQFLNDLTVPTAKVSPHQYDGVKASWYEQHYFMQNQLLKDADFMSMQHGLEIRVPFLDQQLINIVNQLPKQVLYSKHKPAKHLLIHAFKNLLPTQIWDRPKMGFTFPFQEWLKTHPKYLSLKESFSQNLPMQNMFKSYEQNKVHWSKIMSLMVLANFEAKY
ncbi:hypothetical protein A5893_14480 [Pedobacter psychrophilus]|uniref:asparagine synthase (glutamine-hydrolyzing) n=1 Tax=Pedobacter psychrophilus TaxID=1826909 RepID=A0A179DC34_9SPHI|nr:asparagine synthase (glutamine-hydrolyzing) [Pedobacter psychrophilus]OAQ38615.1 hypothetical protein A5893_14480 [Pedobacter psychrophilus]